jgi:hypothetical protein
VDDEGCLIPLQEQAPSHSQIVYLQTNKKGRTEVDTYTIGVTQVELYNFMISGLDALNVDEYTVCYKRQHQRYHTRD